MPTLINPYAFPPGTMLAAIQRLGLTSGLKLCLDAGDIDSYSGSGQKWLDTSGNGYDFFRGTDGTSQSSDPTFNGTAGAQTSSEYWSFDGGDYFAYDSANETWMNNLHKNNAIFSGFYWFYLGELPSDGDDDDFRLWSTNNSTASPSTVGARMVLDAPSDRPGIGVNNGSETILITPIASVGTLAKNAWQCVGLSYTESTGAGTILLNGSTGTGSPGGYSSPSSSSADGVFTIGSAPDGEATTRLPNGSRLGVFCMWEGVAISEAQLTSLYNATRVRFGV